MGKRITTEERVEDFVYWVVGEWSSWTREETTEKKVKKVEDIKDEIISFCNKKIETLQENSGEELSPSTQNYVRKLKMCINSFDMY